MLEKTAFEKLNAASNEIGYVLTILRPNWDAIGVVYFRAFVHVDLRVHDWLYICLLYGIFYLARHRYTER